MFIRPTDFQPLSSRNVEYVTDVFVPAADGSTDVVTSDSAPSPLPVYDTMSIDALLKAGVPLEKVNPHILGESRPTDDFIIDKVLGLKSPAAPADSSAPAAPAAPADSSAPAAVAPTDTL
ncbi:hypothetical protein [Microviridae sp.]|nr:hypothetical protein [Microviridae sp.]